MIVLAEEVSNRKREGLIQFVSKLETVFWNAADEEIWKFSNNIEVAVASHDEPFLGKFYRVFAQSDETSDALRTKIPPTELPEDFDFDIYRMTILRNKVFLSKFS